MRFDRLATCRKCGYRYPPSTMVLEAPSGKHRCYDGRACLGRVQERDRLDAWKRGQR